MKHIKFVYIINKPHCFIVHVYKQNKTLDKEGFVFLWSTYSCWFCFALFDFFLFFAYLISEEYISNYKYGKIFCKQKPYTSVLNFSRST